MDKHEINSHRLNNQNRRDNANRIIELSDAIERLTNNPDFITVIEKGFCGSEMQQYICNAGDDNLDKDSREHSLQMALAGGHLTRWLGMRIRQGQKAKADLLEIDASDEHLNQLDQ